MSVYVGEEGGGGHNYEKFDVHLAVLSMGIVDAVIQLVLHVDHGEKVLSSTSNNDNNNNISTVTIVIKHSTDKRIMDIYHHRGNKISLVL